jgi:hypothetical protein
MNPAASIDAVFETIIFSTTINTMKETYTNNILTRWHGVPAASICAAG